MVVFQFTCQSDKRFPGCPTETIKAVQTLKPYEELDGTGSGTYGFEIFGPACSSADAVGKSNLQALFLMVPHLHEDEKYTKGLPLRKCS
jgi:hypothetical protein